MLTNAVNSVPAILEYVFEGALVFNAFQRVFNVPPDRRHVGINAEGRRLTAVSWPGSGVAAAAVRRVAAAPCTGSGLPLGLVFSVPLESLADRLPKNRVHLAVSSGKGRHPKWTGPASNRGSKAGAPKSLSNGHAGSQMGVPEVLKTGLRACDCL